MTQEEIATLVTELGGIMQALKEADPADKAEAYSRLGVTLAYHTNESRVAAEARPASTMYGGACPRAKAYQSRMVVLLLSPGLLRLMVPGHSA